MNDSIAATPTELAEYTLSRVREALSSGQTACVTQIIEIIRKMSDKADVLSVQDLAEAIGSDLTTMVKVMNAANCLNYNPTAVEVSSLARAVSVIGFNKVQNLVLSLLLLEGAENGVCSEEGREVSARALCSALMAEEVTRHLGLADPEEAFVRAALRNYGRLLLSTFFIEEYRFAVRLARQSTDADTLDKAFREVFGLSSLELGEKVFGDFQVGGASANSGLFEPAAPSLLRSRNPNAEERLLIAAEFAREFSEFLSEPELTSEAYTTRSERLLLKYSAVLSLAPEDLQQLVESVHARLDTFGRAEGFDGFTSVLMQRVKALAEERGFEALPPAISPASAEPAGRQMLAARGPLSEALKQVQALVQAGSPERDTVFAIALGAMKTALRLEACVAFLRECGGEGYEARFGVGRWFETLAQRPVVHDRGRDVFAVCLNQGEDVLIQDPAETKIAPFIPNWFRDVLDGGPFLLLPLKDSAGVFGMICGVARRGKPIELGITRISQFRALRGFLAGTAGCGTVGPGSNSLLAFRVSPHETSRQCHGEAWRAGAFLLT